MDSCKTVYIDIYTIIEQISRGEVPFDTITVAHMCCFLSSSSGPLFNTHTSLPYFRVVYTVIPDIYFCLYSITFICRNLP
jgi:hypothetical protein